MFQFIVHTPRESFDAKDRKAAVAAAKRRSKKEGEASVMRIDLERAGQPDAYETIAEFSYGKRTDRQTR